MKIEGHIFSLLHGAKIWKDMAALKEPWKMASIMELPAATATVFQLVDSDHVLCQKL